MSLNAEGAEIEHLAVWLRMGDVDPTSVFMWTSENRGRYDRGQLRYPSDLTDEEWALVAPLIPPARPEYRSAPGA